MILPDKHIRLSNSLLGTGAALLRMMKPSQTVTDLWDTARARGEIKTFDRFVAGLDLLFILGAVRFEDGLILKQGRHERRSPEDGGPGEPGKTGAAPR